MIVAGISPGRRVRLIYVDLLTKRFQPNLTQFQTSNPNHQNHAKAASSAGSGASQHRGGKNASPKPIAVQHVMNAPGSTHQCRGRINGNPPTRIH